MLAIARGLSVHAHRICTAPLSLSWLTTLLEHGEFFLLRTRGPSESLCSCSELLRGYFQYQLLPSSTFLQHALRVLTSGTIGRYGGVARGCDVLRAAAPV